MEYLLWSSSVSHRSIICKLLW